MKKLNQAQMGLSQTTDVLSFPALQVNQIDKGNLKIFKNIFLGDIVISLDKALEQAKEQNISLQREVTFLILHSILHLIGHDHATNKDRQCMQKIESNIIKKMYLKK